jgi:hypothetical protein
LGAAAEYQPTTVSVTFFNTGKGPTTATYRGISLVDLLTKAQFRVNKKRRIDILRKYVVARGSDCYETVIALGEILPNFEAKQVQVAYQDSQGNPLPPNDGMARLVVPGDRAGGRNVFNLNRLTVLSPPH